MAEETNLKDINNNEDVTSDSLVPRKRDKMLEDFSSLVDTVLPVQEKRAKNGDLNGAIEELLTLEKKTRNGEDAPSTIRVTKLIISLCFDAKDFKALNANLVLLSKRRGQMRTVIQEFVKTAISFLDKLNKPERLELIDTLRGITDGKNVC